MGGGGTPPITTMQWGWARGWARATAASPAPSRGGVPTGGSVSLSGRVAVTASNYNYRRNGTSGYTRLNSGTALFEADAGGNVTGTVQRPQPNGPDFPATIGIRRQALHAVLQHAMTEAAVPIRLGITVQSFAQDGDGGTVVFTAGPQGPSAPLVVSDGATTPCRRLP